MPLNQTTIQCTYVNFLVIDGRVLILDDMDDCRYNGFAGVCYSLHRIPNCAILTENHGT
jgi:hypothetical protein